ncbi:alpha/beta fold hydrolase [Ruegeria hyattellae]|uniref:alpha/beta fold hydrolase n=1 Tax=Ruegeria hyattellae TaxID=3233337 RepID=UPI00355AD64B
MTFAFDTFLIDKDTRELRNNNQSVRIEPKVFNVLVHLLENREKVVSKDELISVVWDGRFISDAAVSSSVSAARKALGDNGSDQRFIRTVHGHGFRFVYPDVVLSTAQPVDRLAGQGTTTSQEVRFCQSADGAQIAYATAGSGQPLVKAANWLSHLEFDWESPVWSHYFSSLVRGRRLIRYDARGNGLSDWNVNDHSFERQMEDLEAVVGALELEKFSIIGISQGCMRGVAYAAKYPERVNKLILLGGYARGWQLREDDPEGMVFRQAAHDMIKHWWGKDNQAIRQLFTNMYMPDAPAESQSWFTDLQRKTTSSENAAEMLVAGASEDIRPLLSKVKAPTLVIHARGDVAAPYDQGRELAAGIKGARFATLDTTNHLMPESDPAWQRCTELISEFLAE